MRALLAAVAVALCAVPFAVRAQEYPTGPIRFVVAYPAGGPNDIIARVIAPKMQDMLGQLIIIDNRGGVGGVIGTDSIAKSKPDGYSIGTSSSGALALSTVMMEKMPYDPLKDLALISLVAKVPQILAVSTELKANSVADLVALAKARPGAINYASTGVETMPHVAAELFRISAGVDVVHVPYRGAPAAVNDLVGHQVQFMFADVPAMLPQIQAGKVRPLAIAANERSAVLPNVPTFGEVGYPQVVAENWYAVFAPAGTPPPVVARLSAAVMAAVKSRDAEDKLASQGLVLIGSTPAEFETFLRGEIAKWGKVVQAAGIKVN
jgi:tripartite-type tricarboxylate transporter receptor subunit TctC